MMTHEDSVKLSQLIGAIKRAKSTVTVTAAQIVKLNGRYAGTPTAVVNEAGVKSLLQARYWLEQAIETFELPVGKSREGKGGAR